MFSVTRFHLLLHAKVIISTHRTTFSNYLAMFSIDQVVHNLVVMNLTGSASFGSSYFCMPIRAPGPGPYTVPSVVGPGPNSARARVAWVALHLNSVPVAPSPSGARLSRRRGGEACEACVTLPACAGLSRAGMRHVAHDFFIRKKGAKRPFPL